MTDTFGATFGANFVDFSNYDVSGTLGIPSYHFFNGYGEDFAQGTVTIQSTTVPEPGTIALFGLGLIGVAASRARARR